jgi:succinate-semialdehyde dehydrogenase/glutarate-semialdehyde dehydrogenase
MKTYPLYLNGDFVTTEESLPVVNPVSGEVAARISFVDRERVGGAIRDAHAAFNAWRSVTAKSRGELLLRIVDEVERRRAEIARVITLETGKPLNQSLGELATAVAHLHWFAEEARRACGRVLPPMVNGKRHLVIKSPLGVIGAITSWDSPFALAVRKVGAALAAGCTVVLKPSEAAPLSVVSLAECIDAAKPMPNVFQLVLAPAADVGLEFAENPLCRKISFTGSTGTARTLMACAARHLKPLVLALGGQSPVIVFDDADLYAAVDGVVLAKFRNSGQFALAASRIYVQRGIYDRFVETFVSRVRELKLGDGLEDGVDLGPLQTRAAVVRAQEHVQDAVLGGAKLLCGGNPVLGAGFFFEATVLSGVARGSLCMQEETLAPIAPICAFDKEEEAVALANDSSHALGAYVFTRDLPRSFRLMDALEAGVIAINDGLPLTSQAPFGGTKMSGWGKELGPEGIEEFLVTKHISIGV